MSREPRGVTGHKFVASTDPYLKAQQQGASSTAVAHAGASSAAAPSSSAATGVIQTISNVRQFDQIQQKRVKPLPPDANMSALAAHNNALRLYQLNDLVYFNCAKCRKNNIRSDLLAVNTEFNNFMCSRCFTKMIRPKNFEPTRLVPFSSLLSWLNYQKPSVFDATNASNAAAGAGISRRFAEAVVPTGDRLATGLALNGFQTNDVRALPSTAMLHEVSGADTHGQAALGDLKATHPCNRVFGAGRCAHGQLCSYANAPYMQAIEYLMGVATREQCVAEGLIVNDVFNLPNLSDPMPTPNAGSAPGIGGGGSSSSELAAPTSPLDIYNAATTLGQWFLRRKKSLNQPEWQLFNNNNSASAIEGLIAKYVDGYASIAAALAAVGGGDDAFVEDGHAAGAGGGAASDAEARMEALMEDDEDLGAMLDML